MRLRSEAGHRVFPYAAAALFGASALFLAAGCAPSRHLLAGSEERGARELFAAAAAVDFPVESTFSGVAEASGRSYPFIAGVSSRGPAEETVGVYDLLGGPVMFLSNDGRTVAVSRGPAAGKFPPPDLPPFRAEKFSLGRVLTGAPGYPADGGEAGRTPDGLWVLEDGRQALYTDPGRRFLSRAEYEFSGRKVAVTYPGREAPGPPLLISIEVSGTRIILRRDEE